MIKEIGWAEPECIIGLPRIQKVEGLYYLYVEQKNVKEDEVGPVMTPLIGKANDAYMSAVGEVYGQPLLAMFLDVPNTPGVYDMQIGFSVREGTSPIGGSEVRYVEPALCASVLVWGTKYGVVSPLMEFIKEKGLRCTDGWREWSFYDEAAGPKNTITWVQRIVEEE